jgi:hypothetical protein
MKLEELPIPGLVAAIKFTQKQGLKGANGLEWKVFVKVRPPAEPLVEQRGRRSAPPAAAVPTAVAARRLPLPPPLRRFRPR